MINNNNIFEKLKGYKLQLVTEKDRFIGLVSTYQDGWVEIVPFISESLSNKLKEIDKDIDIKTSMTQYPIFKRCSEIHTIIILEKPDEIYDNKKEKM